MTDAEIAVQRLTAWVRDFGDKKEPAFIGDLSMVLLLAKAQLREHLDLPQNLPAIKCDTSALLPEKEHGHA